VEPAAARDACAAISGGAASVAGKRNAENNPMHSSEAIGEMRFFRSGLTCRAKQEHGVIMPSFRDGEETPGLRCCAGIRSAPRGAARISALVWETRGSEVQILSRRSIRSKT
jgi:hypothetical protein